jgi:hypothetical protein
LESVPDGKSAEFVYPETYTFPAASVATAIATSVPFPPKVFEYERAGRTMGSAARADTAASARTMAAHLAVPQIPAFHPSFIFPRTACEVAEASAVSASV